MAMDSWLIEDDAMVASRLLCGSAAAAIPIALLKLTTICITVKKIQTVVIQIARLSPCQN
jgi:hypothetical protein